MENVGPILGIAVIFGIIGFIWWLTRYLDRRRTDAMSSWAQANGFVFEGPRNDVVNLMSAFKLFSQGHSRVVKNVMRGSKDIGAVTLLDYQYVTGSGKQRQVHNHTVAVVQTPGRQAPHFFLRKQNAFFDKLGKMFGGQDINFDDDPAFSKAFVLQTVGDEDQLRGFMRPALREALSRYSGRSLVLEVVGDTMLMHFNTRLKPEQLEALVVDAVNVRRNWS